MVSGTAVSAKISQNALNLLKKDEEEVFPKQISVKTVFPYDKKEYVPRINAGTVKGIFSIGSTVAGMTSLTGVLRGVGSCVNYFYGIDHILEEYGDLLNLLPFAFQELIIRIINEAELPKHPRFMLTKLLLEFVAVISSPVEMDKQTFEGALRNCFEKNQSILKGNPTEIISKLDEYQRKEGRKYVYTFDDFARICLARDSEMREAVQFIQEHVKLVGTGEKMEMRDMFEQSKSEIKCVISALFSLREATVKIVDKRKLRRELLHVIVAKLDHIETSYNLFLNQIERPINFKKVWDAIVPYYDRSNSIFRPDCFGNQEAHMKRFFEIVLKHKPQQTSDTDLAGGSEGSIKYFDKWQLVEMFGAVHYIFHHEVLVYLLKQSANYMLTSRGQVQTVLGTVRETSRLLSCLKDQINLFTMSVRDVEWNPMLNVHELTLARRRLLHHSDSSWQRFQTEKNRTDLVNAVGPVLEFLKSQKDALEKLILKKVNDFLKPYTQRLLVFIERKLDKVHIVELALCIRDASELMLFGFNELLPFISQGFKPIFDVSLLMHQIKLNHSDCIYRTCANFGHSFGWREVKGSSNI
jgi:hypothetical protein